MAASTSAVGNKCYNAECKELRPDRLGKGWRLRAGDFADLCDRCGSIYEEGKFCETFHPNASGWRCCESCGKRVHCGCIVSAQAFALLDPGGIECVSCARKSYILNSSTAWPPVIFHSSLPERLQEHAAKSWNQLAGSGPVPWRQVSSPEPLPMMELVTMAERISEHPESSPGLKDLSGAASSSRIPPSSIYSYEVARSARALMDILEEPLSEEAFDKMKFILANLHEHTLPQALSSACALLNLDFWHDWEECENAYADREELFQHKKHVEDSRSSQRLNGGGAQLEAGMRRVDDEVFSIDAEIAKLQVRRAALMESRGNMGRQLEKLEEQAWQAIAEEEAEHRRFSLQKISASRIAVKEIIRLQVLVELSQP